MMVEEITVVVSALAAGAAIGAGNAASIAVMDAYQGLKNLVLGRFRTAGADTPTSEHLLTQAHTPNGRTAVTAALEEIDIDEPTLQAAKDLLDLLEQEHRGKFQTVMHEPKGVQIGDGNTQHNHFA